MRTYNASRGDESSLKILTRHSRERLTKSIRSVVQFNPASKLTLSPRQIRFPFRLNITFLSFRVRAK
jgi:hypothetical protein